MVYPSALIVALLPFILAAGPSTGQAQRTATVVSNAPIYAAAQVSEAPLRVAAVGTLLRVLEESSDWVQVEFNDPQSGRRIGWIEKSHLKVSNPDLEPMDLSVPAADTPPPARAPYPTALPAKRTAWTERGWAKVVILATPDGKQRGGEIAAGSGLSLVSTLRDALVAEGASPFASERDALTDGVKEAQQLGFEFVLRARIVEWEDNATQWSGNPDSVGVSIELFDVGSRLVASTTMRKKGSRWAMTNGTPDRLLPEVVRLALSALLRPVVR